MSDNGWSLDPLPSARGGGWSVDPIETPEQQRAKEEARRGVGTLTGRAKAPSVVDDALNSTPADQTTERFALDRTPTKTEIAGNAAAAASHEGDSWGTLTSKFFQRIGPLFEQSIGGLVQGMAEQGVLAHPDIMATLPGNEGKTPTQIVMEERAKGLVPGQKMYAAATADLEANGYNAGDSNLKYYIPQIAESVVQMIPGVAASIATRNPFIAGAAMAGQVGTQQYGESAQEGRTPTEALVDATWNGASEAIGEEIPVGLLMKPGGKFLAKTLKTAGAEGLQEMFTQVLQTGYDKGVIHPDMTWGEAAQQIVDAGIVGAGMGAALHVGAHPVVKGFEAYRNRGAGAEAPVVEPVAPLTDDDIASPLPDAAIQAGKTAMAELLGENPETGEKIPGASPLDHLVETPATAPKRNATLDPHILGGLIRRGVPEPVARGIAAGIHAESASNPNALNKGSGALGLGQWLGPRKAAIIERYGPNPTLDQQLDFLTHELKGGDAGGAAVLGSADETSALHNYITAFMRPAPGAETTSDLARGMAALGRTGEGITPDSGEATGPSETSKFADELIASVGADKETPEGMLKRVLGEDVLEPEKGQRVDVTQNGQTVPGTVEDIWERDGQKGVRIKQDDGAIFDESLKDAKDYGARITHPVTQPESRKLLAQESDTSSLLGNQVDSTRPTGAADIRAAAQDHAFERWGHPATTSENGQQRAGFTRAVNAGLTSEQQENVPADLMANTQFRHGWNEGQKWLSERRASSTPETGGQIEPGNQVDSSTAAPTRIESPAASQIETTESGKGIAIKDATAEQLAAIAEAVPKARGLPRKDGAIVYSKKYEADIRTALEGAQVSSKTVETQPEESSKSVENVPDGYEIRPEREGFQAFFGNKRVGENGGLGNSVPPAATRQEAIARAERHRTSADLPPPPDFAGAINRDLTPEQVRGVAAVFDRAEARARGEPTPEQRARALAVRMVREGKDTAGFTEGGNYSFGQKVNPMQRGSHMTPGKVHVELDDQRGTFHTFNEGDIRAEAKQSPDIRVHGIGPDRMPLEEAAAAARKATLDAAKESGRLEIIDTRAEGAARKAAGQEAGGAPVPASNPHAKVGEQFRFTKRQPHEMEGEEGQTYTVEFAGPQHVNIRGADGFGTRRTNAELKKALDSGEMVRVTAASDYGAKNKLVTQDRAAELRARLKEKLNPNRLNAGIDPEIVAIGTELAVFHIEAGARRFTDWAKAIAADLDMPLESLRKYLRGWYNGARDMMEDHGESVAGMDTADEVGKAMRTFADWATEAPAAETAQEAPAEPREAVALDNRTVNAIAQRLLAGERFATIVEARKALSEITGETIKPGTAEAKRADEAIEAAVVFAARTIAARNEADPHAAYRALVDLYDRQPNLGVRSSTSIEQQAYSTPVPLAYIASRRAGINQETRVYEPTAGNGALLIDARATYVTANELNPDRARQLRMIYRGATITEGDAMTQAPNGQFDAVIANPPFGTVKGEDGENQVFDLGRRYETREIDHAIAIKALEKMKDGGRAVLLLGGVRKQLEGKARRDAYNGKAKREFYYRLYSEYNVTDHFTVNGDLYAKQGAGWPVDVIVVEGRGKSKLPLPAVQAPRVLDSWNALESELDGRTDVQGAAGEQAGNPVVESPESAGSDGRDRGSSGERGTDRQLEPAVEGEPGAVRERPAAGEPGSERLAEQPARDDAAAPEADRDRTDRGTSDVVSRAISEGENARQVTYRPASGAQSLDTLVPVNMQTAISTALGNLEQQVGKVDAFVADRLGYKPSEIPDYFSAEQVDALALAISNMEKGAGFIIGDQTGIGKGRVVAGVIRYAMKSGRMPIFVTEKPTLYADMYRDMNDIGIPEMLGRPVDIVMTNAAEKVPLSEDGSEVLKTPAAAQHNALLNRIADGDHEGVDVLFTTYAQMQSVKGEWTPRQRAIQRLAEGSILIFDESHNAGGQGQDANKRRSKKKGNAEEGESSAGMSAEAPNRATFARQIAKAAHGVFFSSATYAKRPEVMDLYASTDMRLAVANIENLAAAIGKGGIPMQQVVASTLTEAGQYVRRERSFDGVDYRTPPVTVSRQAYSQFTSVLRGIQEFQEQHIADVTEAIAEDIRSEAKAVSHDGSVGGAGATSTNFTSVMHNVVEQMLLALKAAPAADMAIEALKAGQKPVITLANTMGSFLQEYAEENHIGNGQPMPLDFRSLLHRYLERTRRITMRKPFSNEKAEVHIITDDELGERGVEAFRAVQRQIDAMDLSDVPVSPVDFIRNRLRSAGYKVGEITGRSSTLDYAGGVPTYRIRPGKESSIQGKRDAITGFNNGTIDVMILNQSGSTGLSLHASEKFKDQRPRRMIIAQAERNIDTHMQMLGRIHRTGQVVLPSYDQLVAAVPAEMRPAAVLAKKMASLNANTTGARDSAMTSEDVPDFMNEYGDEIAARLMEEDAVLHDRLGTPLKDSQGDEEGLSREDAARRVTGRLMLLPLEEQEAFYERFLTDYSDFLAQKEAAGEATLEAKTLELDAKQLQREQIIAPTDAKSPFGEGVYRELLDVKRLGKPMKPEAVLGEIAQTLGEELPDANDAASLDILQRKGRDWAANFKREHAAKFDAYRRDVLDNLTDPAKYGANNDRLRANETMFNSLMGTVYPGAAILISNEAGESLGGIVLSVEKKGETKNPLAMSSFRATIALADAAARVTLPFSQMRAQYSEAAPGTYEIARANEIEGQPPLRAFAEMQHESREQRTILTGNILAAYEHTKGKGQIVNFVRDDGSVQPGLMMRRGYDYAKEMAKQPVAFRTAKQVADWLARGEIAFSDAVKIERTGGQLVVTATAAKATGGQFFLDSGVRAAVGGDFYKKSTGMVATTTADRAERVADALIRAGAVFTAKTNLDEARQIVAQGEPAAQPRARVETAAPQSWGEALAGRDAEVRAELQKQLEQFGIADRITLEAARNLSLTRGSAVGQSWAGLISIALDKASDPSAVLSHEAVHAMRDLGLFTPAEWRNLENAAWGDPVIRRWAQERYSNIDVNDRREEAAAEHFARYWQKNQRANSLWGRAYRRIQALAVALAHAVNTLLGRPIDSAFAARLVQDKIISGEIGARATGSQTAPRVETTVQTFGRKPQPRDMVVHHGTPHEFDEFSTDAIGTGEGAQAYGWGLYFTDRKEIAEHYRKALTRTQPHKVLWKGESWTELKDRFNTFSKDAPWSADQWDALMALDRVEVEGSVDGAIEFQEKLLKRFPTDVNRSTLAWMQAHRDEITVEKKGHRLEVDIPEDGEYLLWDKPLNAQPGKVREAISRIPADVWAQVDDELERMGYNPVDLDDDAYTGADLYRLLSRVEINEVGTDGGNGKQDASLLLHLLGVGGIKYLDGASRKAGEGGYNYVLFDASKAKIIARHNVENPAAFDDADTEERWQNAKEGIGGDGPSTLEKARAWWADLKGGLTQHWRDLPNTPRFSDVAQQFRKLEAAPNAAMDASVRYLKGLVAHMDKAEYDLFSRKVVLDDLGWEAAQEHELPFGLTPETLKAERAKIDALIDGNDKLVEAVRSRKAHNRKIADEMVRAGVLTREQIKNPAYFRHMVLDYARHEARLARGSKQVKSPYWARRMGSSLDINANLLEAELDWLQKAQIDVATADTISWLKKSSHNIRESLRQEARDTNKQNVAELIDGDETLADEEKAFRKAIAIGFSIVQGVIKRGEIGPIPSHLQDAADSVESGFKGGEPPFALLAWMMDNKTAGAMGAGMILKATGQRKAWMRKHLGEKYLDPEDVDALVRRLKPEGYKAWQPREGRHFFTAKTISESALDMFVGKLSETMYPGVERDELHKALTTIRPQLVVGGDRYTMVLPTEIADTLTEFGDRRTEGMVAHVFGGIQSAWKRWVLINPRRFLKYNINNMSGDLDAIIAGNPGTLRKVRQAWGELRSAAKGQASDRYREALERGVFTSGLSINEIPDINRLSAVRHLTEDRSKLNQFTVGAVASVWRALQDSTQFRENLFRMAAYLDYVEKIEGGVPQREIGYGASVPAMVDAVEDTKDKAALLARDLVGDYGSVSVAGSFIRRYIVPFWSWMEINTRRYWRLTSNAYTQSKAKGIATGGLLGAGIAARSAATLAIRMGAVYGLIYLWNHLLFGDDEDKLGELQKRQMHLILGHNSDGEVITLRTQGALSDVLGELGLPDAMAGLRKWMDGQGTLGQAAKDTIKAPINRVATSTSPMFTIPLEQALGEEFWPDIFAPRVIHDRTRSIASTFNLENEYDQLAGKPTRGYLRSWEESVVYKRDPGEMAYDTAKSIAYDWLENVKGQSSTSGTSPRSEALRDYRLALRYGDKDAATAALKRYAEFEGTMKGLKSSIRSQHPLGPIAKKDRAKFLESLTDDQLETFAEAEQWYNAVYLGDVPKKK